MKKALVLFLLLAPVFSFATVCEPEPPVVEEPKKERSGGSISPSGVTKLLGCELSPTEVAPWWNAPYWHDVFLQNLNYHNFSSIHPEWTAPDTLPWVRFPELFPQCQPVVETPTGTTPISTPEYDAFVKAQDEYNPVSPCLDCK